MNEETLFAEAIAIESPEKRRQFLDEACGENQNLRKSVEELLHLAANAGSFLEHPPVEVAAAAAESGDSQDEIDPTIVYGQGSTHDDEGEATIPGQPMSQNPRDEEHETLLGYLEPSTQPDSLGRLGHYEILEVVGRGAFGTVLRAFDEKLQRVVAVKVLAPEIAATSPARKRFLREARTSAQIRHENVVYIHAVEDEPLPYLVMEYIPGKTLQRRLDEQGPLDLPDVLRLGKQIADGLAAAHAEGLIHRDIKPANILLEGGMDERVRITDFGLARTADDASMTQSGVIAGTPMYMAPEQAQGAKLDQRADLFSFGSVLYQMLSGRPPFRAPTTMAVLKRVTEDTPRPLQEVIPETPAWICELIGHLHAKNPDERYGSAREVSELLAQCADDLQADRVPQIPDPSKSAGPGDVSDTKSRRREPFLQSSLVKIAAAVVIMLGVLGITEATGVTKLASTVIRLTTGSGTLVIETDDPGIQVTVTGDGDEVTIRGAGIEQLTLSPGKYRVAASKDGKPVKQELVTITRNGRTAVRMHLEPAAPPAISPFTDADVERIAALPAAEQIEEVRQELKRRNPGFDGKLGVFEAAEPIVEHGVVIDLRFRTDHVSDISPVRALTGLRRVMFEGSKPESGKLTDLTPLMGMALTYATVTNNGQLSDLSPLEGMPITHLSVAGTKVSNLTILKEMPIKALWIYETPIADLSPLAGKSLIVLHCTQSKVKTLRGLTAAEVKELYCHPAQLPDKAELARLGVTHINGQPVAEPSARAITENSSPFQWPADAPLPAIAPFDAEQAKRHQQAWADYLGVPVEKEIVLGQDKDGKGVTLTMVLIPPGEFLMGSTNDERAQALAEAQANELEWWIGQIPKEGPQHQVTIISPFYLAKHETTQGQWVAVMGNNPAHFATLNDFRLPVENISWEEIRTMLRQLNEQHRQAGSRFVLPTEAQWEYACRAGTRTAFWCGDQAEDLRGVARLGEHQTHPVGQLRANPFGLYDVHDNVAEFCDDTERLYHAARVMDPREPVERGDRIAPPVHRGGKFRSPAYACRSAMRDKCQANVRQDGVGFRLAVTLPDDVIRAKFPAAAPFTDADVERIAALPAAEQIEEVRQELIRRNPGFDGKLTPTIQDDKVIRLSFQTNRITDISPVRSLIHLEFLDARGSTFRKGSLVDLSPLRGMKLTMLNVDYNKVRDLTPLRGMPLTGLYVIESPIRDLEPLKGMPLKALFLWYWTGSDLTALAGMPLKRLNVGANNHILDLAPLAGMELEFLCINGTRVSDLSPVKDAPLTGLECERTLISDISLLRGMNLTRLKIANSPIRDLSSLEGMPLKLLHCDLQQASRNAEVLRGIKSLENINEKPAAEFWKDVEQKQAAEQAWLKNVESLPAAQQIEEVRQELIRRNPGFDDQLRSTAINSTFSDNAARAAGGGLFNEGAEVTLDDPIFENNTARNGGGIYNYGGSLEITGGDFTRNQTSRNGKGGDIYYTAGSFDPADVAGLDLDIFEEALKGKRGEGK